MQTGDLLLEQWRSAGLLTEGELLAIFYIANLWGLLSWADSKKTLPLGFYNLFVHICYLKNKEMGGALVCLVRHGYAINKGC